MLHTTFYANDARQPVEGPASSSAQWATSQFSFNRSAHPHQPHKRLNVSCPYHGTISGRNKPALRDGLVSIFRCGIRCVALILIVLLLTLCGMMTTRASSPHCSPKRLYCGATFASAFAIADDAPQKDEFCNYVESCGRYTEHRKIFLNSLPSSTTDASRYVCSVAIKDCVFSGGLTIVLPADAIAPSAISNGRPKVQINIHDSHFSYNHSNDAASPTAAGGAAFELTTTDSGVGGGGFGASANFDVFLNISASTFRARRYRNMLLGASDAERQLEGEEEARRGAEPVAALAIRRLQLVGSGSAIEVRGTSLNSDTLLTIRSMGGNISNNSDSPTWLSIDPAVGIAAAFLIDGCVLSAGASALFKRVTFTATSGGGGPALGFFAKDTSFIENGSAVMVNSNTRVELTDTPLDDRMSSVIGSGRIAAYDFVRCRFAERSRFSVLGGSIVAEGSGSSDAASLRLVSTTVTNGSSAAILRSSAVRVALGLGGGSAAIVVLHDSTVTNGSAVTVGGDGSGGLVEDSSAMNFVCSSQAGLAALVTLQSSVVEGGSSIAFVGPALSISVEGQSAEGMYVLSSRVAHNASIRFAFGTFYFTSTDGAARPLTLLFSPTAANSTFEFIECGVTVNSSPNPSPLFHVSAASSRAALA